MKFFRKITCIGLLLLTGTMLFSGCSSENTDNSTFNKIKEESLSDNISSVEVNWVDGTVNVLENNNNNIHIVQTATANFKEKNAFSYEVNNGVLKITDNNRSAISSSTGNSEISIYLPPKIYDAINIQATSGTVKTESIQADSISLDGSAATFQIAGEFGNVRYTGVSGKLTLTCSTMPDAINVDANSGTVNITLPENNGFTLATSGKIECEFPTSNMNGKLVYEDGSSQIDLKITSGSAKITKS